MERGRFLTIEGIPSFFAWAYSFFVRRSRIVSEIYSGIAEEVVSKFSSGKILDVGTGPGFLPIKIARQAPELEISGIDISGEMVKLATKNSENAGFSERVKFFKANASSIPFEKEYFDFVISTFSFHHWLNPVDCLREIFRVLKKGGEAWIYDVRRDVSKEARDHFKKRYGLFFYILFNLVKFHSSVTLKKIDKVLSGEVGFSQKILEDKGILIKIKLIKGV